MTVEGVRVEGSKGVEYTKASAGNLWVVSELYFEGGQSPEPMIAVGDTVNTRELTHAT